jgi:hypothetical protein
MGKTGTEDKSPDRSYSDRTISGDLPANDRDAPSTRNDAGGRREKPSPAGKGVQQPSVEELRPEVLYLRDKNGRLVPVPGFRYEDFVELLQRKQRGDAPASEPPAFTMQQLSVTGAADGALAKLTVHLDVALTGTKWTKVPLGFGGSALAQPASYEGDGEFMLEYDDQGERYIAWLRGEARSEHHLTLEVRAPLTTNGPKRQLALSLPRAAASQLELRIPTENIVARTTPADLVVETTKQDGASKVSVLGVAGEFTLSWSEAPPPGSESGPFLEASGLVLVKIDGRLVTSNALLSVRSFGAAFDRFHVRLPPGSELSGEPPPGYLFTSSKDDPAVVEIKLDKPAIGPIDIRLVTERPFDIADGKPIDLAGFQVLEAVAHRQGGQIGVIVPGDRQVAWEKQTGVRQIGTPAAELNRRDLVAAFEYLGQPYSLQARVSERRPRISVDPQYTYFLDAVETRLAARLKYSIRGAKVFSVDIDIPGWQVEEVGPPAIVDQKLLMIGEDARLRVPFVEPTMGDVEITIRATRAHSANPADIEISMPTLKDAIVGPATVAIVPDDTIELTTRVDRLEALSRSTRPSNLQLPERAGEALVFRAERAGAKYVAKLHVHQQKIDVRVASTVAIKTTGADVEQRFRYRVAYVPLERASFALPESLRETDSVEVYLDGGRLNAVRTAAEPADDGEPSFQFVLPQPRIGEFELVARYQLPFDRLRAGTTTPFEVPLAMPLEGEFSGNSLDVTREPGISVELGAGHWTSAKSEDRERGRNLHLTSSTAASSASLLLTAEEHAAAGFGSIERLWVQTWLTGRTRLERAVFRIPGGRRQLTLALPADVDPGEVEATLDGMPAQLSSKGQQLTIDVDSPTAAHTLELRYGYLQRDTGWSVSLDPPNFGDGVHLRRVYWQLIVPKSQNLIGSSANLTPEYRWVWDRFWWARENVLNQHELENWTDTIHDPLPPDSMNVYLFSAIGGEPMRAWVARRSMVVFLASAVVLATMLIGLYASPSRRPAMLVCLGVAVAILALAYPEPAIVLAQSAVLGLALGFLAPVLRRTVRQPSRDEPLSHVASGFSPDRSSTRSFPTQQMSKSGVSTASVAMALESGLPESQGR